MTLDSSLLAKLTERQFKMARDLKAGSNAFDTTMFVERLFTFMGGRAAVAMAQPDSEGSDAEIDDDGLNSPLQWAKIGQLAVAKSRRVPAISFMCVICSWHFK